MTSRINRNLNTVSFIIQKTVTSLSEGLSSKTKRGLFLCAKEAHGKSSFNFHFICCFT